MRYISHITSFFFFFFTFSKSLQSEAMSAAAAADGPQDGQKIMGVFIPVEGGEMRLMSLSHWKQEMTPGMIVYGSVLAAPLPASEMAQILNPKGHFQPTGLRLSWVMHQYGETKRNFTASKLNKLNKVYGDAFVFTSGNWPMEPKDDLSITLEEVERILAQL
jgi:hypothetical protein